MPTNCWNIDRAIPIPAESRGISNIFDGIGNNAPVLVHRGSSADIWYWALGTTFPDVGGEGNLPGILFGMPPRVTTIVFLFDLQTCGIFVLKL